MWRDFWFGLRQLRTAPGVSAVAVFTLALGIAANTTVFSWIDKLLLHPFGPARDGGSLAVLEMVIPGAPNGGNQLSWQDFLDYRRELTLVEGAAAHREDVFSLGSGTAGESRWGQLVSGNYFDLLGIRPALGRTFNAEEDSNRPGAHPVVVISHGLWRTRFQSDPRVIGKTLVVNRRTLSIIGVAPSGFPGTMPGLTFDLWIPFTMARELGSVGQSALESRATHSLYTIVRLRPGVSVEQARAEAATVARRLETAYPKTNQGVSAAILPIWEFHSAAPELLAKPLRTLMAVSLLVFLIACANVANLLLARAATRRREMGIRLAMGSGGWRIARQLMAETVVLAAAGTVLGTVGSAWMADMLPALVPKINAPVALGFQLSPMVIVFTALTGFLAAMLSGVTPALMWWRADVHETLKETGRSGAQGARSHRIRGMLVASEVALALVALVGTGLFVRSFRNTMAIAPGFDTTNVVLGRFYMPATGLTRANLPEFCERLRERLREVPGVVEAAYADSAPLGTSAGAFTTVEVEGYQPRKGESMDINRNAVSPDYFALLRTPVLEGRAFRLTDDSAEEPVLIINEAFARRYFGATPVVGRKVRYFGKWATVVGVVRDSKYFGRTESPRPHFFIPFRRFAGSPSQFFLFVKTGGDPAPLLARLRRETAAVNPDAAAFDTMMLEQWTYVTMLPQKVAAALTGVMGLIALVLAGLGLYSVTAYAVAQRTQEFGIRMALGARPADVLGATIWSSLKMVLPGLAAGLAAAFVLMHLISGMLFGVSPSDPATFASAALFLAAVAAAAAYGPARRATKVDPMVALRAE